MADVVMETSDSETIEGGEKTAMELKNETALHSTSDSEANQSNAEEEKPQVNDNDSSIQISSSNGDSKRERVEGNDAEGENGVLKKQKVEKLEQEDEKEGEEKEEKKSGPVTLGSKTFSSSSEMFNYFYKFLHYWRPNLDVNKYEYMVLLDLLKKGHIESEKKVGGGVRSFQVRYHPMWKSRCFFLIRNDETVDDFSFRKCVDHILPLPDDMKVKSDVNKVLDAGKNGPHHRGGGSRGGRRGGHGRGWGGRFRN